MKVLYIASLKYSPGLLKEVSCLADCFSINGFEVRRLLSKKYLSLASDENRIIEQSDFVGDSYHLIRLVKNIISEKPSLLLFYNSHILNIFVFLAVCIFSPKTKRALIVHEPCKKEAFRRYGLYAPKVVMITVFNKIQSWICTDLITLSPYGTELLQGAWGYNRCAKLHTARILLPPVTREAQAVKVQLPAFATNFFTFVGHVNKTKKSDWFIKIVSHAQDFKPELKFRLVTGSALSSAQHELMSKLGNLSVINPSILADQEISLALTKSIAVFGLHRGVTQSGVFVECMRHGTPVIFLKDPGFTQFGTHCGVSILDPNDVQELLRAMDTCLRRRESFQQAIDNVYHDNFHPDNFLKFYGDLIASV